MFKQNKPRQFDLKARYYDERKERLQKVLENQEGEIPLDDKEKYRERLRESWGNRRSTGSSSNFQLRLIIILAILVGLVYALITWF